MARNPLSPFRPGGLTERGFGEDPFMSLHREMNRLIPRRAPAVRPAATSRRRIWT